MEENPGKPVTGDQAGQATPGTFTKERVNELMQKRIERSHRAFYDRYGVKDLKGLDDLFGKAQSVDSLNERVAELTKDGEALQAKYSELEGRNRELARKYALKANDVREDIVSDIEAYFKGKGLEIDEDTLATEMASHPEWKSVPSTIVPLGSEASHPDGPTEAELASRYLGVDLD